MHIVCIYTKNSNGKIELQKIRINLVIFFFENECWKTVCIIELLIKPAKNMDKCSKHAGRIFFLAITNKFRKK